MTCQHPAGNAGVVCRPAAGACDIAESCDGVSSSCPADTLVGTSTFYRDADGDGYGNPNDDTQACNVPSGYVTNNADCNDANAAVHPGAAEVCNDVNDDCDEQTDEGLTCETEIFSAPFTTNSDGFSYVDDPFRGTTHPAYADGTYEAAGGFAGGGVRVVVGNVNGADISGMSGGWQREFTLSASGTVRVSLRYRLVVDKSCDSGECGQALVAVDGALLGAGPGGSLQELCGANPNFQTHQDSGWQTVEFEVPGVAAGTHTLTVGGWQGLKTSNSEKTEVFFDDIELRVH